MAGILMSAVQALDKENAALRVEAAATRKRLAELEAKDRDREERLEKLEQFLSETPKGRSRHGGIEEGPVFSP